MKRIMNTQLLLVLLFSTTTALATHFAPRSHSVNTARELAGWAHEVNQADKDKGYGTFAVTLGAGKSFRDDNIARCFFGDDVSCGDCPSISISGSRVENRGERDWLADYFGLPTDYKSTVRFSPEITHFVADFNLYLGCNRYASGLFFRVHAPLVWSKWDLNMCETIVSTGTANHVKGYFDPDGIERKDLACNFTQFIGGNFSADDDDIKFNPLRNCRWNICNETKTKIADVRVILGWNFLLEDEYHLGFGVIFAAPTGNTPTSKFIFRPVVGNGNHWELGGHITTHYTFWKDYEKESSFGFYLDANITHLFKDCQQRCFDLCHKKNSKYMLAQKLGPNTESDPRLGGASDAGVEFKKEFTSVANLTTRNVDASVSVQGDVSAMFNYTRGGFGWDIGYNFWGRACEKYDCKTDCKKCDPCDTTIVTPLDGKTWALKGDAHVFGCEVIQEEVLLSNPVALAATQCLATIHAGTNDFNGPSGTQNKTTLSGAPFNPTQNPGIDAPVLATSNNSNTVFDFVGGGQTHSSNAPVFLTEKDIDLNSARSKGLSHSFFTHISYTWMDRDRWIPYLGAGIHIEIGSDRDCKTECTPDPTSQEVATSCTTSCKKPKCEPVKKKCPKCINCSLSRWEAWLKWGVSFD